VSNGLGAAIAGLTLLAVLLGLTTLLALFLGGVVVVRRHNRSVPPVLKYASAGVVLMAIAVAGFAVVALYDEAAALAGLFVVIVLLPLAIGGGYLQRRTEVTRVDLLSTIGLAWSLPFIFGVFVIFGITAGVGSELGLATTAAQQESLAQLATPIGGAIVVAGAVILSPRVSRLVSSADPS
jgi:hypothetical protein